LDASGLIKTLESFSPPQPDDQAVRKDRDIPPPKIAERVEGKGRRRSYI
jgi:hypothetical protein